MAVMNCPLCAWTYAAPPLDPRLNAGTLAGVFGPGVIAQIAANRQAEDTERALQAHLQGHTLVEWVQKVSALERENAELRQLAGEVRP